MSSSTSNSSAAASSAAATASSESGYATTFPEAVAAGYRPMLPVHEAKMTAYLKESGATSLDQMYDRSNGTLPLRRGKAGGIEILLLKSVGGDWGCPKGHPDDGESDIEGALRETREEVGLDVSVSNLIAPESCYFEDKYTMVHRLHGDKWKKHPDFAKGEAARPLLVIHKMVRYYVLHISEGQDTCKVQEEEVSEVAWHPLKAAADVIQFDFLKKTILALENVKEIAAFYGL